MIGYVVSIGCFFIFLPELFQPFHSSQVDCSHKLWLMFSGMSGNICFSLSGSKGIQETMCEPGASLHRVDWGRGGVGVGW